MSSIPGATNVLPGVFTDVVTDSRGTAVAGGLRVPAIMGEGLTSQTIISYAIGKAKDGLNSSYTSANGADGRHFLLRTFPVIPNRTTLYRNGSPLVGIEQSINDSSFSNKYDYRLDPTTGRIEMQKAYLQDLGGEIYSPFPTNKGDGYIINLELLDQNAPQETWNIRCVDVERDSSNNPKPFTAKFLAVGTISGKKLDANGKEVIWRSNGQTFSNGVIKFAIEQGAATTLSPGDGFTVKVKSGQLNPNDSLTATYIPSSFINDPVQLQGLTDVVQRYGNPSTNNTLSLGAQLAFANQASSIVALQCAPSMPRRTYFKLSDSVQSISEFENDFIFPLPLGAKPDNESNIHFFVTNNITGEEKQVSPKKITFETITDYNDFIFNTEFSYSLIKNYGEDATIKFGFDGYITKDPSVLAGTSGICIIPNFSFTANHIGKTLQIKDAVNVNNNAKYLINSVRNGKAYVSVIVDELGAYSYEPSETITSGVAFEAVDPIYNLSLDPGPGNDGYTGDDGIFTVLDSRTARLTREETIPFESSLQRVKINTPGLNRGVWEVSSYNSLTNSLELKKIVVTESNLTYSILDSDLDSFYVIVTKDVIPDTYSLRVSIVDEKDATFYDAGWINALEALEKTNVDIVVPLPKSVISITMQNALNHCISMSNIRNRKERVLFTGAIAGLEPKNLIGSSLDGTNTAVAVEDIGVLEGIQGDSPLEVLDGNIEDIANYSTSDAFGSTYRCVYFYPDQIVVQAGSENVLVDGFYIAAAAAGYMASQPRVEVPLTNKILSGFSILRNKLFSQLTLESLASSGICTLQPVAGGGRVLWGITTSQSGFAEEQEISIIFIRDRIAKTLRSSFAGYIGQAESKTTQVTLVAQAISVLNSFISQNLITTYANLVVQRNASDPRQWDVFVKVQPTYPVNWIYIKVGVGTI